MRMFRQGDVLLIEVAGVIPAEAKRVERDQGRVVLAYGEVTGHSHAIADKGAALFSAGAERWLRTPKGGAVLYHEEHSRIELPGATTFKVTIQREYQPGELPRQVVD
jgi:hypothetical protein